MLISFAVTAKLICVFVFAYEKIRFSHDEAHIINKAPFRVIAINNKHQFTEEEIRCVFDDI